MTKYSIKSNETDEVLETAEAQRLLDGVETHASPLVSNMYRQMYGLTTNSAVHATCVDWVRLGKGL